MKSDITKEAILQMVQQITIEDGDILVLRCDPEALSDIGRIMHKALPRKQVLLVHEDSVKFLDKIDKQQMNYMGWYRRENDENTS